MVDLKDLQCWGCLKTREKKERGEGKRREKGGKEIKGKEEGKTISQPPALIVMEQGWGEEQCSAALGLCSTIEGRL